MILLLDNYDSFTYNLKQYLLELNQKVDVFRNDEITIDNIEKLNPSHIIISPGPGRPENAGISVDVIKKFSGKIPILGVCLGHQAIGYACGGKIISAKKLMHGKISRISHNDSGIFSGIPNNFEATRYHSLVIERESLPEILEITAESPDGDIMGVRHKNHLTEGIQVHPESILTVEGKNILKNFLEYTYRQKAEGTHIKEAIRSIIDKKDLSGDKAAQVMNEIMDGIATEAQIASFITALRLKGETVDEITACATVMREKSIKISPQAADLVDTCGTGGDESGSINISTAAAIVSAGAGIKIAKHGNRSVSSKAGSADLLEALNVNLDLGPADVARCIDEVGIGFLFAPKLHPAMRFSIGPRREIGVRTVFNILGPLTNPADAGFQIVGVYDQNLVETIANVLKKLGMKRGYVVSSDDGLDEVSISAPTLVATVKEGSVKVKKFKPEDAGYKTQNIDAIKGGSAEDNARIIKSVLAGEKGPCRDIICLNAGFAISACRDIKVSEGVRIAEESIDSGRALRTLERLVEFTNSI
ncbi:MAG: bifunctional anthranilate synthase component II/anthranilate phosphoribosyltransferase [Spirochaetes bacterium]|jgi:anthranilate synthase/phosphoribosyltransferase|nr:bifunctional anthranilate synthase component II/anthranilate phosphoribosyltransferase [Spirochaetota bacterium]